MKTKRTIISIAMLFVALASYAENGVKYSSEYALQAFSPTKAFFYMSELYTVQGVSFDNYRVGVGVGFGHKIGGTKNMIEKYSLPVMLDFDYKAYASDKFLTSVFLSGGIRLFPGCESKEYTGRAGVRLGYRKFALGLFYEYGRLNVPYYGKYNYFTNLSSFGLSVGVRL